MLLYLTLILLTVSSVTPGKIETFKDVGDFQILCKIPGCTDNYLLTTLDLPEVDSCLKTIPTQIQTIFIHLPSKNWFEGVTACKLSGGEAIDQKSPEFHTMMYDKLRDINCIKDHYWSGFHILQNAYDTRVDVEVLSINKPRGYLSKDEQSQIFNTNGKLDRILRGGRSQGCMVYYAHRGLDTEFCDFERSFLCQGLYKSA